MPLNSKALILILLKFKAFWLKNFGFCFMSFSIQHLLQQKSEQINLKSPLYNGSQPNTAQWLSQGMQTYFQAWLGQLR